MFLSEKFKFLEVIFSKYLNRRFFEMDYKDQSLTDPLVR